ncbi:MAG: hypothetical protein HQ580_19610 [Planctomycetes bacterium]|nr:hypothetical protein [Planctomycetota bacterium]
MTRYSKSRQVILTVIATIIMASNLANAGSQATPRIETLDDLRAAMPAALPTR